MRLITQATDCARAGQDPYVLRSCDPWQRLYNYPPVWLELRFLGVTYHTTKWLGAGLAALTLVTIIVLFSSRGWASGLIAFAVVFSWPLLFGLERGNTDLLIFSIAVLALLGMHRMSARHAQLGRELMIVGLSVLKLYPVVMVLMFIRRRTGWLRAAAVAFASIGAIVATCMHRLHDISKNTPLDHWISFGAFETVDSLRPHLPAMLAANLRRRTPFTVALLAAALAVAYGAAGRTLPRKFLTMFDARTGIGAMAVMGLSVYCFTFLLGTNYDYRLIFLLAPLGFLARDLATSDSMRSLPLALLLLAQQFCLYARTSRLPHVLHPLVFLVACTWLGRSLFGAAQSNSGEDTQTSAKGFGFHTLQSPQDATAIRYSFHSEDSATSLKCDFKYGP
jgi:hypothetical protein